MLKKLVPILLWVLCCAAFAEGLFETNIEPSPADVYRLIDQLGADKYPEREKASKAIEHYNYNALDALLNKGMASSDAEIVHRSEQLLKKLFEIYSHDPKDPIPSIWFLPNEMRYPNGLYGRDISKICYLLANKKLGYSDRKVVWRDKVVEQLATKILIEELVKAGYMRPQIESLLDSMIFSGRYHIRITNIHGYLGPATAEIFPDGRTKSMQSPVKK